MAHFERYVCKNEDVFPGRPPRRRRRRIIGERADPRGSAAAPPSAEATGAVPPQITSGEGAAAPSFFMRGQYHFLIYVYLAFRRTGRYSPFEMKNFAIADNFLRASI